MPCVAFSRDGTAIATGGRDGTARAHRAGPGRRVRRRRHPARGQPWRHPAHLGPGAAPGGGTRVRADSAAVPGVPGRLLTPSDGPRREAGLSCPRRGRP
ncbi:WD40 repeat domain-containing protein [Streptomyces atrovirens]|uniref:WD40 repeat domain-containing protein n=1 Tax=Streptomyces atrovirens TaxID=285556 RepID=A0ABW0DQX4_9ACTN